MSPTRLFVPVFLKMFFRWVSIVLSLIKSSSAIFLLVNSFAISFKISLLPDQSKAFAHLFRSSHASGIVFISELRYTLPCFTA